MPDQIKNLCVPTRVTVFRHVDQRRRLHVMIAPPEGWGDRHVDILIDKSSGTLTLGPFDALQVMTDPNLLLGNSNLFKNDGKYHTHRSGGSPLKSSLYRGYELAVNEMAASNDNVKHQIQVRLPFNNVKATDADISGHHHLLWLKYSPVDYDDETDKILKTKVFLLVDLIEITGTKSASFTERKKFAPRRML